LAPAAAWWWLAGWWKRQRVRLGHTPVAANGWHTSVPHLTLTLTLTLTGRVGTCSRVVVARRVVEAAARAVGAHARGRERLAHQRVFVDARLARRAEAAHEPLAHGRVWVDVHVQVRTRGRRAHALPPPRRGCQTGRLTTKRHHQGGTQRPGSHRYRFQTVNCNGLTSRNRGLFDGEGISTSR
jgi:hypothetical protein